MQEAEKPLRSPASRLECAYNLQIQTKRNGEHHPCPHATCDFSEVLATPGRAPILQRGDHCGVAYEEHVFPAVDSVALNGWFIPAETGHVKITSARWAIGLQR
jgi:hypothetical protein